MQNRFGLLHTDVMPIFMIIALDIIITLRFSINCSAVICSPTIIFSILRESSSETYGSRVHFHHISFYFTSYKFPIYNFSFRFNFFAIFYFPIYKQKIPKIHCCNFIYFYFLAIFYTYLYHISPLQLTEKGY